MGKKVWCEALFNLYPRSARKRKEAVNLNLKGIMIDL